MTLKIPQANPGASYFAHEVEIRDAVERVLRSGWYILGQEVAAFESEFANWASLKALVGVANGTDAIALALKTLGIGVGDEVITTTHTAVATVSAIEMAGATPVLVDIDPVTFTLDTAAVEKAVGPQTRAIIPVHIYGMPADMESLCNIAQRHKLYIIEDCAQAHGAQFGDRRVGTFGHLASFSFYPTKNMGAFGDGGGVGMVDPSMESMVRSLAQYGWKERYISDVPGMNTRLDELQAAILRVKLRHIEQDNHRRVEIAESYSRSISNVVTIPSSVAGRSSVFHLYVIRHPERDRLRKYLADRGIGTAIHYPVPVHLQPAYQGRLGDVGSCPVAEGVASTILSLPLYSEMTDHQVNTVIEAIQSFT